MPLYLYRCPKCGLQEEQFLSISNRDKASDCWCATYEGTYPPMERVITAPAIRGETVARS